MAATLSILGQALYNVEVSRYALYTGEPIFAGKLRTLPGPAFWVPVYLMFDAASFFPYLAASGAIPLLALLRVAIPDPASNPADEFAIRGLSIGIFLAAMIPLVFGGEIYNSIRVLMTTKIVLVMGFLLLLAGMFSTLETWAEITSGFFKFGNVPIRRSEDANLNGLLDQGEDWDGDGNLDVKEPTLQLQFDTDGDGKPDATDADQDGRPDPMVPSVGGGSGFWPDFDGDGKPDQSLAVDSTGDGNPDRTVSFDRDGDGRLDAFLDIDGDEIRDGDNLDNVFAALIQGRPLPEVDLSILMFLGALVAISGNGGLGNSSTSNYTREQGWGMGAHVGAIPSIIGGREFQLSHGGMVFEPGTDTLPLWRKWFRFVVRDQWAVWMPSCFVGIALPAMLSLMFLPRGFFLEDQWQTALITANGVRDGVGSEWGNLFWIFTLLCAFLVLGSGVTPATDGFLRRWVDVFWIASRKARTFDPRSIHYVYFSALAVYAVLGIILLLLEPPVTLLFIATLLMNFALGFSCWHTLAVNLVLLPAQLRPGWVARIGLFLAGLFFLAVALLSTVTTLHQKGII